MTGGSLVLDAGLPTCVCVRDGTIEHCTEVARRCSYSGIHDARPDTSIVHDTVRYPLSWIAGNTLDLCQYMLSKLTAAHRAATLDYNNVLPPNDYIVHCSSDLVVRTSAWHAVVRDAVDGGRTRCIILGVKPGFQLLSPLATVYLWCGVIAR